VAIQEIATIQSPCRGAAYVTESLNNREMGEWGGSRRQIFKFI
jgi:hypothetical protein